jgi:CBS domain-containing protein
MPSATTTVGQLMTERLETISPSDTAQEAAKKMRDKKVSSLVVTIDANSSVEVAADIMIQNKVRHLLVVDENKVLGIITPSDFTGYLKEKLNLDDVNARILQSLKEDEEEENSSTTISKSTAYKFI